MCTFMLAHVHVCTYLSMHVHVCVYSFVSLVCLPCICVGDVKGGSPVKACLSNIFSMWESASSPKADIKAVAYCVTSLRREAAVSFNAHHQQLQHL